MTQIWNAVESLPSCGGATPVCLILIQVMRMLSARPQSVAITFWGMFELTIKESEAKRLTSPSPSSLVPIIPLALFARTYHPPVPFFACLQLLRFSLVQCSPLNLRKARGGGWLIEIGRNRGLTESQYITVPLMVPLTNVCSEILSNK